MPENSDRLASGAWALETRAIAAGTLFVLYIVWAAMHDIAHADESDYTAEYIALGLSLPAFAFLYRTAFRRLSPRRRLAWLTGTGVLVALFDLAALSAQLWPRYAKDPKLGSISLAVGLPVLGLIGSHIVREERVRPGS